MLSPNKVIHMYNKRLGVRDMTSEWRDHVATRAREIAADKETEPYRYDVRDEPVIPMEEVDKAKILRDLITGERQR